MANLEKLRLLIIESMDEPLEDSEDSFHPDESSDSDESVVQNRRKRWRKRSLNSRLPENCDENPGCSGTSNHLNTVCTPISLQAVEDESPNVSTVFEQPILTELQNVIHLEAGRQLELEHIPEVIISESSLNESQDKENEQHEIQDKVHVRKKIRNVSAWKSTIRKSKHQAGEAYTNKRGSHVPAKTVKNLKNCISNCFYKCSTLISDDERDAQFKEYYKLTQNEKYHFLLNTTHRDLTYRPKDRNKKSRREFSFQYFFNVGNEKIQVCKQFYLGTLGISQKPVYNVHKNKNEQTNTPKSDGRGKSANCSRALSEESKQTVRQHIQSFPTIQSHYCRASTNRLYLESSLNVQKMYNLYNEMCREEGIEPVKISMYRHIFMTEYNLSFHQRKSDRCDICEEYTVAETQNLLSDDLKQRYKNHVEEKNAMRANRKADRENSNIPILCFDLQNVIACPRSEISTFFYKRKLNTYNLTAHLSTSKTIYCALWTEALSGRAGNDLASALYKILNQVAFEHDFEEIILWSDSCVPQNRNSFISCAVQNFIKNHPQIKRVTMKYSVPGHSCIQEVDNAHSLIEKGMSQTEFFSPLGLIRILKSLNRQHPIRILQMKECDFLDFQSVSKNLNFKLVPFFQVSEIVFTKTLHEVAYKTSFLEIQHTQANLRFSVSKRKKNSSELLNHIVSPKQLKCFPELPADKVKDIKDMLKYMPVQDREFYSVVLKL